MGWEHTTAGQRLEFLANHHKVSMRELSVGAGASATHAEQLINQGQKGMRGATALGYARKWGVSVEWLIEGKGEPFTSVEPEHWPEELKAVLAHRTPASAVVNAAVAFYRSDGARRSERDWERLLDFLERAPEPRVDHTDPTERTR